MSGPEPVILLIERSVSQGDTCYASALKKKYNLLVATTGKLALTYAHEYRPRVMVLNALSMRTLGSRIIRQFKDQIPSASVIHLLAEKPEAMEEADVTLWLPFTARKISNCIERELLQQRDDEDAPNGEGMLVCGPFALNRSSRVLSVDGQETPITPKLMRLVEQFFLHPGETLDRKTLMEHVWQTNYMGDTRTLNVHIRWIRRVLEPNPSKPKYLKTVRGVGYRLDIPEQVVVEPMLENAAVPAAAEPVRP